MFTPHFFISKFSYLSQQVFMHQAVARLWRYNVVSAPRVMEFGWLGWQQTECHLSKRGVIKSLNATKETLCKQGYRRLSRGWNTELRSGRQEGINKGHQAHGCARNMKSWCKWTLGSQHFCELRSRGVFVPGVCFLGKRIQVLESLSQARLSLAETTELSLLGSGQVRRNRDFIGSGWYNHTVLMKYRLL